MAKGNADVSVDGVYVGHTPLRHFIAPGMHRVSMVDTSTFKRASIEVRVSGGRATPIDFPDGE
jgi:hypothetical protein